MLKAYVHQGLIKHFASYLIGAMVICVYWAFAFSFENPLMLQKVYDPLNNQNDLFRFIGFILILFFLVIQFAKSYLLYVPSTYLSFNEEGILFKKLKREYKLLRWEDIEGIEMSTDNEWLLTLVIVCKNRKNIEVQLTSMWLLSLTKRWCVTLNFLRLYAIALNHPNLMSKLNKAEVEELKQYVGIS